SEREWQHVDRQRLDVERSRLMGQRPPVRKQQQEEQPHSHRPAVSADEPSPGDLGDRFGRTDSRAGQTAASASPTRPCIACSSDDSSAAFPGSSAVARPPYNVRTRSQKSGNSASSELKTRIAAPSAASRRKRAYTWRFVLTSI